MRQANIFSSDLMSAYSPDGTTLFECLKSFFKPELLGEMKCENCSSTTTNTPKKGFIKKQAIAKLPDCLCIQIQRNSWSDLNYEMIKKTNYVQFPLSIKIDDSSLFSSNLAKNATNSFSLSQVGIGGLLGGKSINKSESTDVKSQISSVNNNVMGNFYELRAAVVHYGSAHSGHFVVFRKSLKKDANSQSSDEWLQISDSDIKKVKQPTLLNSNVYMLFYDKTTCITSL